MNLKMMLWQHGTHNFRPFNQANALSIKVFIQSQIAKLLSAADAIKIEMEYRQAALIFVDQSERRTGDLLFHAKPGTDAFHAGRFAAAQIAEQSYYRTGLKLSRKGSTELKSLLFALTDESYQRFRRRLVAIGWIILLRSAAVYGTLSSLWLKRHDGENHLFQGNAAVLKAVGIVIQVIMVIGRVDEIIIFFGD